MHRKLAHLETDLFSLFYSAEGCPYEIGQKVRDVIHNATGMLYPTNGNAKKAESIERLRAAWIDDFMCGLMDRHTEIVESN